MLCKHRGSIDVPAVGCGIAHHVEGLCLDRLNGRLLLLAQILGREGPVAHVERQLVLAFLYHLPFVVGIAGVHVERLVRDVGLADLLTICHGTDEGCVPAARCEAELHLALVQ